MTRDEIRDAARVVNDGGIIAYPTEACYGLGCDPRRHDAIRRLLRIKQRSVDQGLILIGSEARQIAPYVAALDSKRMQRVLTSWPGPFTWLLPVNGGVSPWLRGHHQRIALRITAHPGAAALCQQLKRMITSTSANRHAGRPARSAGEVRKVFGDRVDYILSGSLGPQINPSEIRDALSGDLIRAA